MSARTKQLVTTTKNALTLMVALTVTVKMDMNVRVITGPVEVIANGVQW